MASGGVGGGRYYCHYCQRSTNPTLTNSVLKCNICHQGFIEEVESAVHNTELNEIESDAELASLTLISEINSALGGFTFGFNPDIATFNLNPPEHGTPSRRSRTRFFPDTMSALIAQLLANGDLNSNALNLTIIVSPDFGIGTIPPASTSDIASLPRRKLGQDDLRTYEECSICLEKYKVNDETMSLPCLHHFHQTCLATWLSQKGSCPICRKDIRGEDT
uniref:RING-type E3 ubiquitin transferase n=1 Tax=Rodentolepis nana TaxID=102285 RepID=A0A0R3TPT9_RODNA